MADKNKLKAAQLARRQFRSRKNLFGTDTEIAEGVRVALEPLTKQ